MNDFVHLHLHTEYSLLDGACRIKHNGGYPLFEKVKELGQKAVAITDHGVMYGAVDFYNAAKECGIKPIIGCEVYVAPRTRFDKIHEFDSEARHLVLLCENYKGYQNLCKLVSLAFTEGFYIKPRVDYELLAKYSEGLIALSACLAGEIPRKILAGDIAAAKEEAIKLRSIFGENNFFLELQNQGIAEELTVNSGILQISKETGIPLVATNDVHYIEKSDAKLHDIMLCIQTGHKVDDEERMRFSSEEFYLKSGDEMAALFPNIPECIENTVKIAERCNVDFEFGKYKLPAFDVPDGKNSVDYLKQLVYEGFEKRFPNGADEVYKERLEYELSIINQMGFPDYFLIVSDFINYAKKESIPVGPGRGSAAGSLVAYCLYITDIDPIKYSLVFERFLNPERVSMPDIDTDFCYVRRQEVIDYVIRKYGENRVAQIVTFGTMAARAAIRDVGRALGMPYGDVDTVAKQIPFEIGMTIDHALEISSVLSEMYNGDEKIRELIDMAKAVEGMPRHASTHAAGVVITQNPVSDYVPLAKNDESVVTQYTMGTLERLGLLKMDFLGLRTLTVIGDAVKMIRKSNPDFDIEKIPDDDAETFEMLSRGETSGVFQVESEGMTNMMMSLRPQSVEDITAAIALYRPGPMQYIPKYVEGKHNKEKITYSHPLLEPILSVTYGCIVYQEQVMQVFRTLAGYSLGKADLVRKAMSKKKLDQLEKERQSFIHGNKDEGIAGAVSNGIDEALANRIFDEIMDFGNYAFNKSHSVCYAIVSYRTAYLKCHFPKEFMAALLTSVLDSSDKVSGYIQDCRDMGIQVLPPDVNLSDADFTVSDGAIRFGLVAIKNIGRGFVSKIIDEREQNGSFDGFQDFCERMAQNGELNRRSVESLIKCGAFDSFGDKRSQLMRVCGKAVESASGSVKNNLAGQMNLFSSSEDVGRDKIALPNIDEFSKKELLAAEKETLGFYISGHPMEDYRDISESAGATSIAQVINAGESGQDSGIRDGSFIIVTGILTSVKLKNTKSGSIMAYLTIEDLSGTIEMLAFSKILSEAGAYMKEDNAVIVRARVSVREEETPKLICENLLPLAEENISRIKNSENFNSKPVSSNKELPQNDNNVSCVFIKVSGKTDERIKMIIAVSHMFPGKIPLKMVYNQDGKKFVSTVSNVSDDSRMIAEFREILGNENVALK